MDYPALPSLSFFCWFRTSPRLNEQRNAQRTHKTRPPNPPIPRMDNRLAEPLGEVPDDMARAVEEVEHEGPGDQQLRPGLNGHGQGGGGGDERGGLEVPAGQGRGEVREREEVERGGEAAACDARPHRGREPGLLVVVGGEVRGDGAGEALGG